MAKLVLPNSFSFQPQYPAPISQKWAKSVLFASVTGVQENLDLVSKQLPASTVSRQATPKGVASYTGSGTSGLVWSSLTPVSNTGNGLAFLLLANPSASATQGRALFLGNEAASFYNQCDLIFNSDSTGTSSSGIWSVTEYNNAFGASAQSSAGQMDGNWHVFIANRPSGTSPWSIYRDGVNVTSSSASAAGIALTAGVRVHCAPTTTSGYTGNAVLAAVLSSLSLKDIADLSDNPWALFQAPSRRLWAVASGSVAITGQSLAATQGILAPSASVSLTGSAVAASQGVLTPSVSSGIVLSGQSLTGSQGTVAPSASVPMAGQSSALAQGALTPGISLPLSGQSLSGAQGSVSVSVNVPLTGQSAALSQGTLGVSANISVALTGIGLTASQGTLSASVPLTGGHFAGDYRKNRKRNLVDHDRDDIARLIREQIEGVRKEIAQAEVPKEVKAQAKEAIKPYQSASSVDVQALQQELTKVRQMLHMWEQQVKRERDEDEELLFLFH